MTDIKLDTDFLDRFIFENKDLRACVVNLQQAFQKNCDNKHYPPVIKNLLGEFMLASVLLSSNLKFKGRLVLQLRSSSSLSLVMAECNNKGDVRAYAQHEDIASNFSLADVKDGTLAMTVEPDEGEAYQGIVPLLGDKLSDCLAFYFEQSEQLKTHFHLVCDAEKAAGFMLQQLPAQLEKDNDARQTDWLDLQTLASTLSQDELLSLQGETIMHRLYHEYNLRFLEQKAIQFSCRCSRDRMDTALVSVGKPELDSVLLEQGKVEMNCEFCSFSYEYSEQDIQNLFSDQSSSSSANADTLH